MQCLLIRQCICVFYVQQWVSHRNHRGNICGVDFIWLCNPNKSRKPLKTSWGEAVFGILKVSNLFGLSCIILIKLIFNLSLEKILLEARCRIYSECDES